MNLSLCINGMNEERKIIIEAEGKRFRRFRELSNMSREEAAAGLGITARTLASYENGKSEIRMEKAVEMARLYGVTFEELTEYREMIRYAVNKIKRNRRI